MDPVAIGQLITVICGGAVGVIGAIALLKKAANQHSDRVVELRSMVIRLRSALRSIWDWVEFMGLDRKVPRRVRLRVLEALQDADHEIDGPDTAEQGSEPGDDGDTVAGDRDRDRDADSESGRAGP